VRRLDETDICPTDPIAKTTCCNAAMRGTQSFIYVILHLPLSSPCLPRSGLCVMPSPTNKEADDEQHSLPRR